MPFVDCFLSSDHGDDGNRRKGTPDVDQGVVQPLLHPPDETHAAADAERQDENVRQRDEAELASYHNGKGHGEAGYDFGIQNGYGGNGDGLDHGTPRATGVEIDRQSRDDVLPIRLAQESRDGREERRHTGQQVCQGTLQHALARRRHEPVPEVQGTGLDIMLDHIERLARRLGGQEGSVSVHFGLGNLDARSAKRELAAAAFAGAWDDEGAISELLESHRAVSHDLRNTSQQASPKKGRQPMQLTLRFEGRLGGHWLLFDELITVGCCASPKCQPCWSSRSGCAQQGSSQKLVY
ncbi:hypothetical protein CNYM01_05391 [Colletotrichum nymphaeae SA-01]|uniref:Uncharacterized protein n=1 Tax=Colletotrichum nymphaeae SA-01 TaxID=1460502 RepID=A0A135UHG2_9PEZI|nr:hypothetical protein CNYM01_05391 [Colletotrichum nymphaeae SA-01]